METRLVYCNLGFQNFICINLVKMIIPNNTRFAEQMRKQAKEENRYINAAQRKQTKSLVFLQTGEIVGVALYPATVTRRFQKAVTDAYTTVYVQMPEEKEERDDHLAKAPRSLRGYADDDDEIFDDDEYEESD